MSNHAQNTKSGGSVLYSPRKSFVTLEDVADYDNLLLAFKKSTMDKQDRGKGFRFELSLGRHLRDLHEDIIAQTYRPSEYNCFRIWCTAGQKWRDIAAPGCQADIVVQHAIKQRVMPDFDRGFILDSYGCRIGGGTHKASDRIMYFISRSSPDSYFLQTDFHHYYPSVLHDRLRESFERRLADPRVVDLMMLFASYQNPKGFGLNIGNPLSQDFGLIYLDRFDHFVKRVLKVKHYVRYVDDCVFIGESLERCQEIKEQITIYARDVLGLTFSKAQINKVRHGVNFAGFRHFPGYRLIRKRSLHNFSRFLRKGDIVRTQALIAHALKTTSLPHLLARAYEELDLDQIALFARRYIHALHFQADQDGRP